MPTTTIALPSDLAAQLDALARAQGGDSQEIAIQALRAFIAAAEDRALGREALAELDRGEGVPAEQVAEEMAALLEEHGVLRARQAAIRGRVAQDLAHE